MRSSRARFAASCKFLQVSLAQGRKSARLNSGVRPIETTIRLSRQELWVAGTVLALHVLAGFVLLRGSAHRAPSQGDQIPLIIHWIERVKRDSTRANLSSSAETKTRTERPNKADPVVAAQDQSRPQGNEDLEVKQLLLSIPEEEMDFSRNPLARHEPLEATPERMKVTMVDRSFGGMAQRMVKYQNCKDLRRALAKTSGDATTIMATMKKEGCFRS